jgi:hypothetical protein
VEQLLIGLIQVSLGQKLVLTFQEEINSLFDYQLSRKVGGEVVLWFFQKDGITT